jgi:tRNA(Ile)-lysidine synthase TilS/MesJ
MRCDTCGSKAVFFQSSSGRHLCGRHLVLDIEARAKRSIRSNRWLLPGDCLAVPLAGDRKSAALLAFLKILTGGRRDVSLCAILPREDGTGERNRTAARMAAESLGIACTGMPETGVPPAVVRPGITRIALPVTLDDIAECVLREFLFGNAGNLIHPGPSTPGRSPVIFPFLTVSSGEAEQYWDLAGTGVALRAGTPAWETFAPMARDLLKRYTTRHPATNYALLHLAEELGGGDAAGTACCCAARKEVADGA